MGLRKISVLKALIRNKLHAKVIVANFKKRLNVLGEVRDSCGKSFVRIMKFFHNVRNAKNFSWALIMTPLYGGIHHFSKVNAVMIMVFFSFLVLVLHPFWEKEVVSKARRKYKAQIENLSLIIRNEEVDLDAVERFLELLEDEHRVRISAMDICCRAMILNEYKKST